MLSAEQPIFACSMAAPRVLVLSNRVPYPLRDGGALAMHAMLQGLTEQGFDVHLLAMNTSRHFVDTFDLPPLYKEIGFTAFEINTDIRPLPLLKNWVFGKEPNHAERFYDKGYEEKLAKLIADFEPQFIQLESVFLATYIPLIRSLCKAKLIIRLHNIEYQIWERLAAGYNYSLRRYYIRNLAERMRVFEQQAWQRADLLMPITKEDETVVLKAGTKTLTLVVPFGIKLEEAKTAIQAASITQVYHLGAMDWMPNADGIKWFVEEVWPAIYKAHPQMQFTYAGRAMPPTFVRLQGNGVTNAGEVQDANDFISDKKILIVPLLSGSGIRVKVLEAMAAGKLVISTTVGMQGIAEAKPGIHYLKADSPDEFLTAVTWALSYGVEVEQMCKAATSLIHQYYNHEAIMLSLKAALINMA